LLWGREGVTLCPYLTKTLPTRGYCLFHVCKQLSDGSLSRNSTRSPRPFATSKARPGSISELIRDREATQPPAHFHRNLRATRLLAGCFVAHRSKTTAGILPLRFAHPAKIRGGAAIPANGLGALGHGQGQPRRKQVYKLIQNILVSSDCFLGCPLQSSQIWLGSIIDPVKPWR
jgi:hypothetical protein